MSDGVFPGATKSVNVLRNVPFKVGNNLKRQMATIATGVSVLINSSTEVIDDGRGGLVFSGGYKGSTFLDSPIFIGDILQDPSETEADGTFVQYQVQGKALGAFAMSLRLERTAVGVS